VIRDDEDFARHLVKHGHVLRVAEWPHSSFHAWVARGRYELDWGSDRPERISDMTLD
jgi:putative transposase